MNRSMSLSSSASRSRSLALSASSTKSRISGSRVIRCTAAASSAASVRPKLVIAAASRWCSSVVIAASSCSCDQAAARSAYHSRALRCLGRDRHDVTPGERSLIRSERSRGHAAASARRVPGETARRTLRLLLPANLRAPTVARLRPFAAVNSPWLRFPG
jgi:hypothetical protein